VQRRSGGVVLARGGNRVALGEGVAHKLYAEVLDWWTGPVGKRAAKRAVP